MAFSNSVIHFSWIWFIAFNLTTNHYDDVTWMLCSLKLPAIQLFVQQFIHNQIKETSKFALLVLCEGNSLHKGTVMREKLPFDNVIMLPLILCKKTVKKPYHFFYQPSLTLSPLRVIPCPLNCRQGQTGQWSITITDENSSEGCSRKESSW